MDLKKLVKRILNEELLKLKGRPIHLNPENLDDSSLYVRGIIDNNGNLYVMDYSFSHIQIVLILFSNDLIPVSQISEKTLNYIIPVERHNGENTFYLSFTYSEKYINENLDKISKILTKCRVKNPNFKFLPKRHVDVNPPDSRNILSYR